MAIPTRTPSYFLFNIGGPYTEQWWARNVYLGVITAGFDNAPGDRGEAILRRMRVGDWAIAYANGYGAIGAGVVGPADTYRLVQRKHLPAGYESRHRHLRTVRWVHYVTSLDRAVPLQELRLANNRTQTKTRLAPENGRRIVTKIHTLSRNTSGGLADQEADWHEPGYTPTVGDLRTVVERQIRERRGQQQFRDGLCERYGRRCMATGCAILAALEAAHINPYRGPSEHHVTNGLLLRADIHTLFDLDLVGIHPKTLRIELHPELRPEYKAVVKPRLLCGLTCRPDGQAMTARHARFVERCGEAM